MMEAWIIDAVRTPRGKGKAETGALSSVHPQELVAQSLQQIAKRNSFNLDDVDDVVMGCVSQVNEQGACLARHALLSAGWPESISGVTVNRFCGSGAQAVNFAALGIMSAQQDVVVAGGVESMSRVPIGADGGSVDGNNPVLRQKIVQVPQGISADLIATREGFSRHDLDSFAVESQSKAARAMEAGHFEKSLFPVTDPSSGQVLLAQDEYPRPGTDLQALGKLKPAFEKLGAMQVGPQGETIDDFALRVYPDTKGINHVHTAGNSSGIVDGVAALLLASKDYAQKTGLKARARIVMTATLGNEPVIMLTAPAPTCQKLLKKAGMQVSDVDLWEINEAFAVVPMQTIRTLGLDPEKVNVNGGAIALGHPLGATGAILIGTVLDELERRDLNVGMVTLCIGGGMGIATLIERI
ncbi:MAG: acetyl-CoA C-acetyltransferase [Myxococcales bacterium]|nr:MAG: acetyl-CoA C-acetyltransferase [Myxococcales bacterium]